MHTCGFDSILSLGVYFLQSMLAKHGVPATQIKYRPMAFSGGFSGGTIDSMMAMMEQPKKTKTYSSVWLTLMFSMTPCEVWTVPIA